MNKLTLGSLFDGSGGFPLGGLISGITPVWASEIEPFPIRVTTKRLPFMKHYGDISQMDGGKIEPVDIICFGSPCTDMSIAGRRAGLDGQQSVLFYEAVRIIKEMRCATNGKFPRWICWENVTGAYSSNSGHDFKAVLEAIIGIAEPDTQVPMPETGKWPYADCYMGDGWSVAYRTLDAQFWGVPQRRKRIYLVADFAGRGAFDVLFKSEGMSRYSAESFREIQRIARGSSACSGTAGLAGCGGKVTGDIVLNDQGGNRMDVTNEVTATLRAEAHHPPCVLESAGFCTEHSAQSRGIGYEEECAPTLRAGVVPAALALENHPADSRVKLSEGNRVQALTSRMGTGGGNVPMVMKIRSGCAGGGKGPLVQTNKSATLSCNNDQTLFEPCNWDGTQTAPTLTAHNAGGSQRMPDKNHFNCVLQAYGICSKDSNAMKSDNPRSGFYEAKTTRTIDANGGNPSCNQGGMAVVSCAVAAPIFSSSKASFFTQAEQELANTLVATDYKDPPLISTAQEYTVRRLTPTECARLQGFPDWWCENLGTEEPLMRDACHWQEVFETHRRITGKAKKPKTLVQISRWLQNPHSDAAEYKMWGNGVALPCVFFVLSGIVWYVQQEQE